jgi:DNA invertase Pin-like site-specific DNA recombinase
VRRQSAEVARLREVGIRPTEIDIRLGIGRASVYRVLGSRFGVDRVAAKTNVAADTLPLSA